MAGPHHGERPSRHLSDSIAAARVICILGIVYVHAWTGLTADRLAASLTSAQSIFHWVLMEIFGRSAVPLLGMISGWLVAGSRRAGDYRAHIGNKARTILLPMILWNALSILLVSGSALLFGLEAPTPASLRWLIDALFCLSGPSDINVQMAFLRDLFVCMAVAPLLLRLRTPWLGLAAFAAALWTVEGWQLFLLLRPQILFFFLAGIAVRRMGLAERAGAMPFVRAATPFAALVPLKLWSGLWGASFAAAHPHLLALADLATRLAAALFFWRLAWGLAGSAALPLIRRVEPYAFLLFCLHLILIWLGGPLLARLVGPMGAPLYPALLLAQPFLILALTIPIGGALARLFPATATLLSGGRLRPEPRVRTRPRYA